MYDFISCFDDQVMLYHILARFNLQFVNLLHIITTSGGTRIKHTVAKSPSAVATRRWQNSFLFTENHIKFVLAKFQVCCMYQQPPRNFKNDPYKIIKGTWVLSVWEWQQLISNPKKYQFKHKKIEKSQNKNSFIDVLQSLKSDH